MDAETERDLYKQLLELGTQEEVEPFLKEALAIIVKMTGAQRGYIEISGSGSAEGRGSRTEAPSTEPPRFWMAHDCSETEVETIREAFSSGIIGAALATGKTIVTPSALEDPRFRDRGSVRRNRIEAVLCAPIGTSRPFGVLYLQGRDQPDRLDRDQPDGFSQEDQMYAELFTRYLVAFADRLLILRRHLAEADPTQPYRARLSAKGVIGRSPTLAALLKEVSYVAPIEISVLLTGPTGAGKTQIARVIHASGPRATNPFVEINCANLPEALLESELFGAMPGSHSTATRRIEGKVTAAQDGTLFLDEVAELSPGTQAKLLHLLQFKEYSPLGSTRTIKADVRIIAATNVDLKARAAERKFRDDLFFRLDVMPIRVPSLAERREDIAELAASFCNRTCTKYRLRHLTLSVGARYAIEVAEWAGNIRELENKIEAAAVRADGEGVHQIERRHVFPEVSQGAPEEQITYQTAMRSCQEKIARMMLEETDWNVTEAAKRLEISRSYMNYLIKAHGLERKTT